MVALSKKLVKQYRGRYASLGTVTPQGDKVVKTMVLIPQLEQQLPRSSRYTGGTRRFEKLVAYKPKEAKRWQWIHPDFRVDTER